MDGSDAQGPQEEPADPGHLDRLVQHVDFADQELDRAFLNASKLGLLLNASAVTLLGTLFGVMGTWTQSVDPFLVLLPFLAGIYFSIRINTGELTMQERRAQARWDEYDRERRRRGEPASVAGAACDVSLPGLGDGTDPGDGGAGANRAMEERQRLWERIFFPVYEVYDRATLGRYWHEQKSRLLWLYGLFAAGVLLAVLAMWAIWTDSDLSIKPRFHVGYSLGKVVTGLLRGGSAACEDATSNPYVLDVTLFEDNKFWTAAGPGFVPRRGAAMQHRDLGRMLSEEQVNSLAKQVLRDRRVSPCRPRLVVRGSAAGGRDDAIRLLQASFDLYAGDLHPFLVQHRPPVPPGPGP